MKKKIFIIAGEKSGDLLGSKILKHINKDKFEICGIGGELMINEGFNSLFSIDELAVMGIFEILPKLFKLIYRINETAKYIISTRQDIVLTIDSPDFCFRVMEKVTELDIDNKIKKVHFIAPSVWAYRKSRAKKIAKIYDRLFCILPFEPPYFEKYGLKTIFVGHPIFDSDAFEYGFNYSNIEYNENSKIISITVGSRKSEINILLPIVSNVIKNLQKLYNFEYKFLVTESTQKIIENYFEKNPLDNIEIISDWYKKNLTMRNSFIALAKSGTNTLEIAAYSVPMVVVYRFNFLTNIIGKFIKYKSNIKYANLINILNNKEIIPEALLGECNSKNITKLITDLIDNRQNRYNQTFCNLKTLEELGFKKNNSSAETIVNEIYALLGL